MDLTSSSSRIDRDLFDSLIDRTEVAATTGGGLTNIAEWIAKNTRHPKDWGKAYSFVDHEFQIGILNDDAPHVFIRKATQISASELALRHLLAVAAKLKNVTAIYTMPSFKAAAKLAATRVDPIINSSPRLKSIVDRNVDSTELKRLADSHIYFSGAATTNASISVPARALYVDELAFSSPDVIATYTSRLGHNLPGQEILRYWSSPLHPKSDISHYVERGDQRVYMVYHDACGQWVELHPLDCLVLPGFDADISTLTAGDLDRTGVRVDDAYVLCPHCRNAIAQENLCDPTRRAWVPKYPSRDEHSYDAPWHVLPRYRTPSRVLKDLRQYKYTPRWIQFAIGLPSANASEQIMDHVLEACFTATPPSEAVYGAVVGVDVGAVSHLCVGAKRNGILEIFRMETVRQDGENRLKKTIVDRFNTFHAIGCCIDAAPDVSIVSGVQSELPYNMVSGVFFVRGRGKSELSIFEYDEARGVLKVARTRAFDRFVDDFNTGKIKLPAGHPAEKEIKDHFSAIKRVINFDAVGEEQAIWVSSTDSDHWLFSVLYAWLAAEMAGEHAKVYIAPASMSLLGRVRMRAVG